MTQSFLEVEAKFAVPDSAAVPELTRIGDVAAVRERRDHNLSAIYYDTADLRLTHAKITLRRRTGGKDDGWHIKLPGAQGRTEIHAELSDPVDGRYEIPAELLNEVRAIVRNGTLNPIAQVDNNRTELQLVDSEGAALAEFCDDHVTAFSFLPGGAQHSWREWEFELSEAVAGTDQGAQLVREATSLLIGAGARVSSSPSKLSAALGESIDNAPLPPSLLKPEVEEDSPAAAVIAALQANRDKLIDYDPRVRHDEWDSVHQMRVATRELRSHLRTFHGIVSGPEVESIEGELKQLAAILGSARDAEVVDERWQSLLSSEDSGTLDAVTREHIEHDMGRAYKRAHRHVVAALDSDRYLDLLEALDEFLANPPVAGAVGGEEENTPQGPADEDGAEGGREEAGNAAGESAAERDMDTVLAEHLAKAYRKLVKSHHRAVENWENPELSLHEREDFFHDMRKSAKKLRYAAEAVGSATNLKTKSLYKACKDMQSVLGDFQDSVTSRDRLLSLADAARQRGEDTFGYGVLYQRERTFGLAALEKYMESFKAIKAAFKPLAKKFK